MEEIEVPVEKMQEEINEHAHHEARANSPHAGFSSKVALSSAIFAVMAAVSALMAGHHSNEAMIDQIHASDHWSYYQAKGIKSAILSSRNEILTGLGKPADPKNEEKLADYKREQDEISAQAREAETASLHHLRIHEVLARAVTFFQIAITLGAIAVLTHRRKFWYLSLAFSVVGFVLFVQGLVV